MDLKDKVVFVTGSSRGIGAAIAKQFAKEKCHVILNARKEVDPQLVAEIQAQGVTCEVILGDISKMEDCKKMVKEIYAKFDQLDILINNAGITNDKLMIAMDDNDFRSVLDVNLVGTFQLTQLILKKMFKKKTGVIINLASVVGLHGNIGQANYAASKAGVIGLTKTIAKEGALRNVRCNAIAPGMIVSDMTDKLSDKVKAEILTQIPLNRFGNTAEIAQGAVFLAQNEYITGQVLSIDGGMGI